MPIYSYKCKNCGKIFDKFQKAVGNGNVKCIYCDSNTHRLFSPVGIIFKGSGFYTTDYKYNSSNKSNLSKPYTPDKKKKDDSKKVESGSKINKEKSAASSSKA